MYAPKTARCSIMLKLGAILLTSASDEKIAAKRIYSEYLGGGCGRAVYCDREKTEAKEDENEEDE